MTGQSVVSKLYSSIKFGEKGEKGIVGVIGGSTDYTGAPFFSAISALRTGADMVHVFCDESASTAIKSYSPECIVHPILHSTHSLSLPRLEESFFPFGKKLSALVVGPGLSMNENLQRQAEELVKFAFSFEKLKVIVFDADSFAMLKGIHAFLPMKTCILTPNRREFQRLLSNFVIFLLYNSFIHSIESLYWRRIVGFSKGPHIGKGTY
jgi:ATP-dependent NAD(P)H-hydrate dehydratase